MEILISNPIIHAGGYFGVQFEQRDDDVVMDMNLKCGNLLPIEGEMLQSPIIMKLILL